MKSQQLVKMAAGVVVTLGVIVLAGASSSSPRVQEQDDQEQREVSHQDRLRDSARPAESGREKPGGLVGLGSFIVNAQADCNGCHTGGGPPNFNYAAGGNPYFWPAAENRPDDLPRWRHDFFSAVPPWISPVILSTARIWKSYVGPDIITRNLTPDKTGRPEGGHTLSEFKRMMRTGIDYDHIHPTCTAALRTPTAGKLHSTPCGRQNTPGHALAAVSQHDRPSTGCRLRISERDPLHRQHIQHAAGRCT